MMIPIPIDGFHHYLIDRSGAIWATRKFSGRLERYRLKGCIDCDGYTRHGLSNENGVRKNFFVHRLLAITFISPPPFAKAQVRHADGNPQNNALENLSWGTSAQNAQDKVRHGRSTYGEKNCKAKLTAADVRNIRIALANGVVRRRIVEQYGISREHVRAIVIRKCWPHIKDEEPA